MIKKYSGHIIGFLSSIVFFMSLAYIVKPSSESLKNENSFRVVDFIRLKKDTSLKEKSRTIPDKPEPPKKTASARVSYTRTICATSSS
jgi:hypothetical protein